MSRFIGALAAMVLVNGLGPASAGGADKPRVRFELRRAEEKPAKGLVEAKVASTGKKVYLHKKAEITNEDVAEADITEGPLSPLLALTFTEAGRKKMEKLTKAHRDKPLALLLDGKVLVAPFIRSTISDKASLSGISKADMERIVEAFKRKGCVTP